MNAQKQHVDMFRKLLLRRQLLKAALPGAAYVPFCGDGDIAVKLYTNRKVYAADLDAGRVTTARNRLPKATIVQADCDVWPFPGIVDTFAVRDFDAYSNPYSSFHSFWQEATKAKIIVLFFTDGHRKGLKRTGHFHRFDGSKEYLPTVKERRPAYNAYFSKFVKPDFEEFVRPSRLVRTMHYTRKDMLYWGAVVEM